MILSTAHTFPPGAGDVWFSLNGTTYQNNSLVTLKDIGEWDDTLLCVTNLTACCRRSDSSTPLGNWFFPNRTRVPASSSWSDFFRSRDQMVVRLIRRRGGVEGIYRCEIPDSTNVLQSIYIGVYTTSSGEWHCLYALVLYNYCNVVGVTRHRLANLSPKQWVAARS